MKELKGRIQEVLMLLPLRRRCSVTNQRLPFKVCALGHSSWRLCLKHIVFSVTNVCIYTPFFSQNVSHELENTSVSLCETA